MKYPKKITESINYAIDGIVYAFKTERSLKIHFSVAIFILILTLLLKLDRFEILMIFFAITLVILAEMVNTAIEAIVNLLTLSHHPLAKIAKDVAAGGVLITCLNALVVAYLIIIEAFKKPFYLEVFNKIKSEPSHLVFIMIFVIILLVAVAKVLGGKGTFTRGGLVSGHAAVAFGASTAILCITKNTIATFLAFLVAILVAQSRIEANIHRWIEVILGALIGILVSLLVFVIFASY
ncbi:MAG: diacylglycerol kinase [Firmicutes bacterium]|nr:diacylglycerol kinase [Bacillota bacterium]